MAHHDRVDHGGDTDSGHPRRGVHPLFGRDGLKISEVVDAPKWTASAYIPESIFREV